MKSLIHSCCMVLVVLVVLGTAAGVPSLVSKISLSQVPAGERIFVDEYGRQRFFHGINAVVKGPPWIPSILQFDPLTSLSERDFSLLVSLGLNFIRLGIMWPGLEPIQGQYSSEYLDVVDEIITQAASHGIYTLLDMHQDLLSEFWCGEGIPLWAAALTASRESTFPIPLSGRIPFSPSDFDNATNYSIPTRQACARFGWGDYYFTEADSEGFQSLYDGTNNLTFLWGRALGEVAARFRDRPEVLGIELINEPWAGNVFQDPELLIPGVADLKTLQPAYQVVAAEIRKRNDEVLLFFEGTTWSDLGFGFSQVPGGPHYSNRSVVSFHYYVPPQLPDSEEFDFDVHIQNARDLECGYFLSEFGSIEIDKDFVSVTKAADDYLLSWGVWEWKDYCRETNETLASPSQYAAFGACKTGYGGISWEQTGEDWQPITLERQALSRAYPLAVAGTVQSMSFQLDPVTFVPGPFSLAYNVDITSPQPTEIFIPEAIYFSNFTVSIHPSTSAKYSHLSGSNLVYIIPSLEATQGSNITVLITPLI